MCSDEGVSEQMMIRPIDQTDRKQVRRNALEQARKIKPEIPLIGMDGIPLKHEIELELIL